MIGTHAQFQQRKAQRGVGIIEILVTIVLLSVGFLATARMQVESMRFSQSAYYQSQAYFMASDIINRMRTNAEGVADGYYDNISTASGASNPNCSSNNCNAQSIAQQDIYDWSSYLHAPSGSVNFVPALPSDDNLQAIGTVEPVNDDIYTVTMEWSELIGNESEVQSLSVNFALSRSN